MFDIVVGIPTVNRAPVLREMLAQIASQTRAPDRVIVCGTKPGDVEGVDTALTGVCVIFAKAGLTNQRNAVIDAASEADVIVFFDDDFLPHPHYLQAVEHYMQENPRTVVVTGKVLADGINGPGLPVGEGKAILAGDGRENSANPTFSGYGCNMAIRMAPVHRHGLLFDECLPLYSWQEDVDLSRQLAAYGDIIKLDAARGVHLGVKMGRVSGVRFGYSQVANPLYLFAKRRGYPFGRAVTHIGKNIAKNTVRSFWSEPYVDRRGRLRGNVLALWDLMAGRISPKRILDL
jgi:GT2 family glycosyltransferase